MGAAERGTHVARRNSWIGKVGSAMLGFLGLLDVRARRAGVCYEDCVLEILKWEWSWERIVLSAVRCLGVRTWEGEVHACGDLMRPYGGIT